MCESDQAGEVEVELCKECFKIHLFRFREVIDTLDPSVEEETIDIWIRLRDPMIHIGMERDLSRGNLTEQQTEVFLPDC
jgi:hypothetical protein